MRTGIYGKGMGIKMEKWARVMYQPCLPLGEGGKRLTGSEEHILLSKEAAKEGMVLLKNNGHILPLQPGAKVALFGKATFDYVKGGGGSGDVTVEYVRNLYEGMSLQKERVSIFEPLCSFYHNYVDEQYRAGMEPGKVAEPEVPEDLFRQACAYTDTAILSICRFSGEGWDRSDEDFYLSEKEKQLVEAVKSAFSKVIVVLNVGGMVDTSWFVNEDAIQSVLLAWQGGMEGGLAAAELLTGQGNPSGKLTDTFAKELTDYPSTADFRKSPDYVEYTEDIYVGYRYFETIPGASERVNYPFGYGLSYTQFSVRTISAREQDGIVEIVTEVKNIGETAGKEVVQVYFSAPSGKLGKPARELAAFQKTERLLPGEAQTLTLSFPVAEMASYDDLGKVKKAAYVLEQGSYHFFVGTSVRDAEELDFAYIAEEDQIVRQLTNRLVPAMLEKRMLADGSFEKLPLTEPNDYNADELERIPDNQTEGIAPQIRARERFLIWTQPYKKDAYPLKDVAEGKISLDTFVEQLSDEEAVHLLGGQPNTGVANTFGYGNLPEYGIPSVMTADGPAGLRIEPKCGVATTAWPCATLLACSWDEKLVEAIGAAGGAEVKENNIAVWLTPAVNIHRSPSCGRNFEYYSEDPFLTGRLAGAMVRGIQSNHIGATVKHFALNDKEENRRNSDSRVSERAAREIYLKAFEMIVKENDPWSVMTSYNIINEHRASENADLLEGILRGEWGYEGCVTTDWWTCGEHYKEVKAGNDVKMGCGYPERLLLAMQKGCLSRAEVNRCVKRVLELILKVD